MGDNKPNSFPEQVQDDQTGIEEKMDPKPEYIRSNYKGSGKLQDKVALITGGDSGIGRAIAIHFAREGADVAICFIADEQKDAEKTKALIEKEGRKCLLLPGDLRDKKYCIAIVEDTVKQFGKLNVLVNNAACQVPKEDFTEVKDEDLEKTFDTNILSFFRVSRAALKHLKEGDSIINTTSIDSYLGHAGPELVDYASSKGAITAFTRSLSGTLAEKKIRVNAVAPGPIWTPLIVTTMPADKVSKFGSGTPLGRAGQPCECATAYVFLASEDSSYFTGQVLHPNGGTVVNG